MHNGLKFKEEDCDFGKLHIVLTVKGCTYRLYLFDLDYIALSFISHCALYKASSNNKACFLVLVRTEFSDKKGNA